MKVSLNVIGLFLIGPFFFYSNLYSAQVQSPVDRLSSWGKNQAKRLSHWWNRRALGEKRLGNIASEMSGVAGLTAGQNLLQGIGEAAQAQAEQNLGNIASGMSGVAGLTAGQNLGRGIGEAAQAQAEQNLGNIASEMSGVAGLTAGQNLLQGIGEAAQAQAAQNFLEDVAKVAQSAGMQNIGEGISAAALAQDAYNRTMRGRLNQIGESVSNQFGQLRDWWNRPAVVPTMADVMSNTDAYFQPSWSQRLHGYGHSAMNWAGSNAAALRDYVMASRFVDNIMVNNFTHYIDRLTADNPLDESAALTKRLWQSADQNQRKYLLYTLLGLGGAAGLYATGLGMQSLYNRLTTPQGHEEKSKK